MSKVVKLHARQPREEAMGDEALAHACAAGDPAAIGALFDRFQERVARYAERLVGRTDAEDVVQLTFLEVARGQATYDGRARVSTWLLAIATNVARHQRRSAGRRRRLGAALESVPPPTSGHTQMEARAQLADAKRALAALSVKLREAFVLCELEGLGAREAGRILGASEAAVWKRVSKARAQIRAWVETDRR